MLAHPLPLPHDFLDLPLLLHLVYLKCVSSYVYTVEFSLHVAHLKASCTGG